MSENRIQTKIRPGMYDNKKDIVKAVNRLTKMAKEPKGTFKIISRKQTDKAIEKKRRKNKQY